MAKLTIKNLNMCYKQNLQILKQLNLQVNDGELVSILGPSGCGKTTTLRIIAGLLKQTKGMIMVDDQDISDQPVHKRNFGMVFQSYALFPHLNVFENVAFGLKQRHEEKSQITKKVDHILELVGMADLAARYPKELSGGQQQRVSLARALVVTPKLLLMDEPLSNLDAKLRISMREEIRKLQQKLKITTIFVTHDQEECFAISDRVAVMNDGKIEQFDTPQKIYNSPRTAFVAKFTGYENLFEIKQRKSESEYVTEYGILKTRFGMDDAKYLTIRPERIQLGSASNHNVEGKIIDRTYLGRGYRYSVLTTGGVLKVDYPGAPIALEETVYLKLDKKYLIPLEN